MDIGMIENFIVRLVNESDGNHVSEDIALSPDLASMRMYSFPTVGVAACGDKYFKKFKETGVVGPHFILPEEWLPGARSVISVFFSLSDRVLESNRATVGWPSDEWLHARFEGQQFINGAMNALKEELARQGYDSVVPSSDPRFSMSTGRGSAECSGMPYTSVWSERHVAYACGLGTFGLSKGLITKRGMAGRFGSAVTTIALTPTPRGYSGIYEYCVMCGACVKNCPVGAITIKEGKNHRQCDDFIMRTKKKHSPRYGCGKCQVAVPCERKRP